MATASADSYSYGFFGALPRVRPRLHPACFTDDSSRNLKVSTKKLFLSSVGTATISMLRGCHGSLFPRKTIHFRTSTLRRTHSFPSRWTTGTTQHLRSTGTSWNLENEAVSSVRRTLPEERCDGEELRVAGLNTTTWRNEKKMVPRVRSLSP